VPKRNFQAAKSRLFRHRPAACQHQPDQQILRESRLHPYFFVQHAERTAGNGERHETLEDKPVTNLATPASLECGIASDLPNGPPLIAFDNGLTFGPDQSGPAREVGNTYAFSDTLTWVRGHSTWKFGAGFTTYQQNTLVAFFTNSNYFLQDMPQAATGREAASPILWWGTDPY
jgi:hypothetical protein